MKLSLAIFAVVLSAYTAFAQTQSVHVNKTWIKTAQKNGENGIEFHFDMSVSDKKDNVLGAYVYFYDTAKHPLVNVNARQDYRAGNNSQLCVSKPLKCGYDATRFYDEVFFIPFSQFPYSYEAKNYLYNIRIYRGKWYPCDDSYYSLTVTNPPKRTVLRTWSKSIPPSMSVNFTRYNDGWVDETAFMSCNTMCQKCGGLGKMRYPDGMYYPCPYCSSTGKCSSCKGTGWVQTYTDTYFAPEEKLFFSNGTSALYLDYKDAHLTTYNFLYQGLVLLIQNTKIVDAGSYYKYGEATLSKDLQTMTYKGTSYKRCDEAEFQRIYGDLIRQSNQMQSPVPVSGGTGGYVGGGNQQPQQCSTCYGTGRVPLAITRYYTRTNSTYCDGYSNGGHVCDVIVCNTCKQNHCKYMQHDYCPKCGGRGVR